MITSSSNAKIKNIIALQKKPKVRKEQGLFVVEGRKLVGEVPAGWISEIYVSKSYAENLLVNQKGCAVTDDFSWNVQSGELQKARIVGYDVQSKAGRTGMAEIRCEVLSDELFAKVSDTHTPQGILALVRMPSYDFSDLMGSCTNPSSESGYKAEDALSMQTDGNRQGLPLLLILEDIQDPGNLGTILRTAEGAGVTGVIMSRGTVDIYNPKVVRSTMGSIYRVPFFIADDFRDAIWRVKSAGVKLYAAHLNGSQNYDGLDYCKACGFLIGNEANGLSDEIASLADAYVRIPMCGQVESLNAAVSAALLSYEAARQRRHNL